MEDFQVVSFMDLLSQCVSRCVIDWRCFCDRQENDESFIDSHVRNGIIQFCRAQREIFLKLYLLNEFIVEQEKLDRILEKIYSFENYLDKCGSDIAMNLRKVQASDLMVACPNTALAVDLLSTGRYTRMPLMLPQLAESAISNSVPLPPLSDEEADLTMSRLKSEYNLQFYKSECKNRNITIECRNGHCIVTKDSFFTVTLVYDFFSWQALAAVPLLLELFGCSTEGEVKTTFLMLIIHAVAIHNKLGKGNIFDAIYACANVYCGKLIMDRLKAQASDYKGIKLTVTDYKFYVTNDPDHTLISCSDVRLQPGDSLVLELLCFPSFRYNDIEGLTVKFVMDVLGNITVSTVELAELIREENISEHRLDKWLDRVAELLERYQLEILKSTGNVFMNYSTGSLNISGLNAPFSLAESGLLIAALKVRSMLLSYVTGLPLIESIPHNILWNVWRRHTCRHCGDDRNIETSQVVLNAQQKSLVCDFWYMLDHGATGIHGVCSYLIGVNDRELAAKQVSLYFTIMSHNELITGRKVLGMIGQEPFVVVELSRDYKDYTRNMTMLICFIKFAAAIHHLGNISSKQFSPADACIVGLIGDVEFTINQKGECQSVTKGGAFFNCRSSIEAIRRITSMSAEDS